jgi:hypothetical protein
MPFGIFSTFVKRIIGVSAKGKNMFENWIIGIDGVDGAVFILEGEYIRGWRRLWGRINSALIFADDGVVWYGAGCEEAPPSVWRVFGFTDIQFV